MRTSNHKRFLKKVVVGIAAGLLINPPVRAQVTTANLSGLVLDQTGAVVSDAEITIMNRDTGLLREARTDEGGYFIFPLLPPGGYTLTAEMIGFAIVTVNDVVLRASINTTVQIILQPGHVSESIDVKATAGLAAGGNRIDITNATQKYSITNEQVITLPILTTTLGRNTLEVLPFLVPGVLPTMLFSATNTEVNRHGRQMSVNGGRVSSNSFNVDGGDNNDPEFNQAAAPLPNPDALSELTVITNNYQADLGRSTGGILNAVAKSGTNQYHGNARTFVINEALNARSFFDAKRPLNRLNTLGAQIGGPLSIPPFFNGKNRSFFFFDYEGTRARRETISTQVVPTERERRGDFSLLPSTLWPFEPLTGNTSRGRFPGGVIPDNLIDPIARLYLDRYIPLPNEGDRLLRRLLPIRFDNDQATARLDHSLDQATTIGATYFFILSDISEGAQTFPVGSTTDTHAKNHNFVLRGTRVISPRTVNQMTGALTRFIYNSLLNAPGATGIHPREVGFTGIHPQTTKFLGVPSIEIFGTDARVVTGGGSTSTKTVWQIKDDLSHTRAGHQFKLGAEARGYLQNTSVGNNNGRLVFAGTSFGTLNVMGDFLIGKPAQYTQTSGNTRYPRHRAYYFYGMDDWRARDNLTISAGLRYELAPNARDELDQVIVFRPGEESSRFPNAPRGLLFVGDRDPILGEVPRSGYPSDKNNLAPRLGIAYSPRAESGLTGAIFGPGKSALRVGLGVFYGATHGYNLSQQASTQPFSISQTIVGIQIHAAGGTFANPFGSLANPFPIDTNRPVFTQTPVIQPIDPGFRTGYVYHYNLTFQRELTWRMLIEIAYVGNSSFKLDRERELNLATVGPGANAGNVQSRRLYRHLGRIPSQESSGRARFDSFQMRLTRRQSSGLGFDLSYALGKSLDDVADPFSGTISYPLRWARSSFDRRHSFVASYTYSLPNTNHRGIAGAALDGWEIGGITQFYSGSPLDVTQLEDSTLTGRVANGQGSPDFSGRFIRFDPRQYRTIVVNGVSQSGNFFFDPSQFRELSVTDYRQARPGTLGRNLLDGPGIDLWSLSIIKKFRLTEAHQITVRSDIRNLFNRANFLVQPTALVVGRGSPLGQALATGPGRIVQISLRYGF